MKRSATVWFVLGALLIAVGAVIAVVASLMVRSLYSSGVDFEAVAAIQGVMHVIGSGIMIPLGCAFVGAGVVIRALGRDGAPASATAATPGAPPASYGTPPSYDGVRHEY